VTGGRVAEQLVEDKKKQKIEAAVVIKMTQVAIYCFGAKSLLGHLATIDSSARTSQLFPWLADNDEGVYGGTVVCISFYYCCIPVSLQSLKIHYSESDFSKLIDTLKATWARQLLCPPLPNTTSFACPDRRTKFC
jgi:hypothetical protein